MKTTMGEFLATLRRANGFTQQEVAEKLGVSNRTLSSWETDRTAPDLLILPAIADLYGVTVDEILRGERKAAEDKQNAISDDAKRNLRKRRFAKYGTRRLFCLGFALLSSLIFLAACAVLLYSSAPLWLSVLLMVIGAGGALACVILTACFAYSAIKAEGLVLKEDYTEANKPYAFCVRHAAVNSLFWLSLPHILGAIVFLTVFFAAGYWNYQIEICGVSVLVDYTTPTVTLVCLNVAFALAFFLSGICLNLTGVFGLGTAEQRAAVKSNGKLLGKIAGFSAIPVVAAFILMAVMVGRSPVYTSSYLFEVDSIDEVRKAFQTYKTHGVDEVDTDGTRKNILPAGEYCLDFQTENYVRLRSGDVYNYESFYELGNGFYGKSKNGGEDYWSVYYVREGKNIEDATQSENYLDYLVYIAGEYRQVHVPSSGGHALFAVNVNYDWAQEEFGFWQYDGLISTQFCRCVNYYEDKGVYRYEERTYFDYSLIYVTVFCCTVGATAIADTIAYFIKRKRTEYSF